MYIFVYQLGSFLTSKLNSVEKTVQKNTPILLFLFLVQKQTSLDKFGWKNLKSDEKV